MAATISNTAAIAACNAVVDLLDSGGTIQIRTGSKPSAVSAEATGTLLATLTLGAPAFGAAVDASPGGQATANEITDDSSADASGDAGWFRALNSGGTGVIDGTVTATGGGGDLELNAIAVVEGAGIRVVSWTFTVGEG